jgi:hypothetical protein
LVISEKYLDCGNPRCGFARIRCTEYRTEYLFQADVYGSETSSSADRLSGVLDGR